MVCASEGKVLYQGKEAKGHKGIKAHRQNVTRGPWSMTTKRLSKIMGAAIRNAWST